MGKLKSPSNSMAMPPPPKILRSSNYVNADVDVDDYSSRQQLALIPPATTTTRAATITSRYSKFKVPHGWVVQEVPRSGPSKAVDKYYYEPGTGLKFRSLRAVERYINGEEFTPTHRRALTWHNNHYKSPRYRKMIICCGKMMTFNEETLTGSHLAIVAPGNTAANSPYNLPDGWIVEEVPRRDDSHTDKYYYEPGSGQKFRSFTAAQRYIEELKEDIPLSVVLEEIKEMNRPLSKAFKLRSRVKNPVSCKKQCAKNSTQALSFVSPPMKVNWVLDSPQGDAWKPFIVDMEIPVSVKQQWDERFKLALNAQNHDISNCSTPS
ncbi:hypothetical protein ACH5RR_020839 [Cinchona calisaya]|uniref:MBD domain-containing protein n=1 Tax=Cinchona calisaya TaxID=153742 RepID=A0ABD2ZJ34_9GENT